MKRILFCFLLVFAFINAIAKDINSDADWASVTATDEVYVKCNTTIPSDITCKSLYLNNQGNTLNCSNHKITVLGKLSINGYESKITNANLDVSGNLELLSQNSSISGTLVKVGGNITINGYEAKINANVECAGSLSMSNQNTKITGSINIGKDITISGYSAGVGGNVVCGGDFTMSSQNSYIQGDVSVKGDINMTGNSSSISGSATAGGTINTSNNSSISGSQSQNDPNGGSATSGEEPSGEEPSGEEPIIPDYTVRATYDESKALNSTSESCSSTIFIISIDGDNVFYNGFCIYDKNNSRIDIYNDYTIINLTKPIYNGSRYGLRPKGNDGATIHGWLKLDIETKSLEYFTSDNKPECGPSTPYIKVPDKITIQQSNKSDFILIPISAEIKNCDDCLSCGFTYSLSGDDSVAFEIVDSKIKLKSKEVIGNYNAKLTVSSLCDDCSLDPVEIQIEGVVCDYPACYDIIVDDTKDIITVCTDENGDLTLDMDDGRFANKGTMRIPKNTSIKCRNINIYNNNQYGKNMQLICDGTIECEDKFNLSNLAQNNDNSGYFITSCFSTIKAKTINISYVYSIQPFSGNWIADNIVVRNGQGQNIHFTNCSDVYAKKIDINANFSDGVKIDGHVVVDTFIVNRNLYAQDGSILTIGKEQVSGNFEAKSGSIINVCYNPNKNQADGIGTCNGCTIFYNYGEKGWDDDSNPIKEGDVTGTVSNKGLQQVYSSYEDCIGEKNLTTLLGIDDDPFLPKDKEIRSLYNCNPCSKDFEDTKIELREIHGRTFRLINGEFIYCENDNDD